MMLDPGNEFKVGYLAIQVPLVSTSTYHNYNPLYTCTYHIV